LPLTRKSKIIIPVALAVYIADRLTKLVIMDNFGLDQSMPVIKGFFDITYVRNPGAAFSVFSSMPDSLRLPFFLALTLAAIAMLVFFVRQTRPEHTVTLVALAMILGGAAGNLTDRLLYGSVVDFICWSVGRYHWPAFNIADSGITVGCVLLGIEVFFGGKQAETSGP